MKTKHTKGKWSITNRTPNGMPALKGHIEVAAGVDDDDWRIAAVFTDVESEQIAKANARLIAAAPELLNSLIELSDLVEKIHKGAMIGKPIRTKAIHAIKKATE